MNGEKWVIFDFDGTISETTDTLAKFWNERLAKKYKLRTIDNENLNLLKDMNAIEKIKFFKIPFYKLPFVVNSAREHFHKYADEFAVVSGLKSVCEKLIEKGYKLSIVSSNREANIRKYLLRNKFDIFSEIFCDKGHSLFVKHKTIKKFLREYNISQGEAVYIGDESRDVVACRNAGIDIISVTWGWDSREVLELVNPHNLVNTSDELYKKVVEILGRNR
ncbi:MAG: HAD-IA family hydrolase [Chitinispirillales bacterium]|jgi:phosphoglycolate phosphatase|nr:HAD-IA family hydrolase [Chitinispirillales bacterium]